jgi:hypothetical protein
MGALIVQARGIPYLHYRSERFGESALTGGDAELSLDQIEGVQNLRQFSEALQVREMTSGDPDGREGLGPGLGASGHGVAALLGHGATSFDVPPSS